MKNLLNSDVRTFAVKLSWRLSDNLFICQGSGLIEALKKDTENKGIEFIKEFDPITLSFKKVSKDTILKCFSWDTEVSEYLKQHYYFKK